MDVSVIYTWRIYFPSAIDGFKKKMNSLEKSLSAALNLGYQNCRLGDLKFTVGGNLMNGIF